MNLLLKNAFIATFLGNKAKKGKEMSEISLLKDYCVLTEGEYIKAVFPASRLGEYDVTGAQVIDCGGKMVTAGYVDCHTHLVFAGDRAEEFNLRLKDVPYMEIMRRGGGIIKTVEETRKATLQELYQKALENVKKSLCYGVTTLEAKSGYGLDIETELKQIAAADMLNGTQPLDIVLTYMGAHATPKNMLSDEYVDFIIEQALPQIKAKSKAEFCDCFCEKNVFSLSQCERILTKAKQLGFKLKIHAEEIEPLGGSGLAAKLDAVSCEHLLKISDENIRALSDSKTVAVTLPITAFSLREAYAPARKMVDKGCALAAATDFNPGSCNCQSIPLLISLCVMYMGLTIEETLCAITLNAAAAIDRAGVIGTVEKGKFADLLIHNVFSLDELCYNFCANSVQSIIKKGKAAHANHN